MWDILRMVAADDCLISPGLRGLCVLGGLPSSIGFYMNPLKRRGPQIPHLMMMRESLFGAWQRPIRLSQVHTH